MRVTSSWQTYCLLSLSCALNAVSALPQAGSGDASPASSLASAGAPAAATTSVPVVAGRYVDAQSSGPVFDISQLGIPGLAAQAPSAAPTSAGPSPLAFASNAAGVAAVGGDAQVVPNIGPTFSFPTPRFTKTTPTSTNRATSPAGSGPHFSFPSPRFSTTSRAQGSPTTTQPAQAVGTIPAISAMPGPGTNPFLPVSGSLNLSPVIPPRGGHPVPRLGISSNGSPIPTNKFYANIFLGAQAAPVFMQPYSLAWSKGGGTLKSWGMAVSQVAASQRVYGNTENNIPGKPNSYYINPIGIQSLIFGATELGQSTSLTSDSLDTFSANANLNPGTSGGRIQFPLVQGTAFVTAVYTALSPVLQSAVGFASFTSAGTPVTGVYKYRATLYDGTTWLVYAVPRTGADPGFKLASNSLIQGPSNWNGFIQVAKNPGGAGGEAIYDKAAGVYAVSGLVAGAVSGSSGAYSLSWAKAGVSLNRPLLMFALPHHLSSFQGRTAQSVTSLTLSTTTKGNAVAVFGDIWYLTEPNLPTNMDFAPWKPGGNGGTSSKSFSSRAAGAVTSAAQLELSQDMNAQSNLDSMYFAGKALAKFAGVVWAAKNIGSDSGAASRGLASLEAAMQRFVSNKQINPLAYDTDWKGVVSTAGYTNSGADFGNTYYNDHHFHYGYHIYTAAVIGSMDPSWLAQNRGWVNMLVRDAANPSSTDGSFPVFRMFDFYNGHSWAKGLFESFDGKDEESTSEDVMFAYAIKMWGKVTGDASMEARGNLMLSILARTLSNYFLMTTDNTAQPSNFIANKAAGITFMNKIDHTTYFGANYEYVEGIHMIPLLPSSALTRSPNFVTQEWNSYFANGAVTDARNVQGGWKGLLYANLALINPVSSFNFFSSSSFDSSWLDGGASKTWYLAFAAGLGGA